LGRWDAYSEAISETFAASHTAVAPWKVIRADDRYRARLAATRAILSRLNYAARDGAVVDRLDPKICGGPDVWQSG